MNWSPLFKTTHQSYTHTHKPKANLELQVISLVDRKFFLNLGKKSMISETGVQGVHRIYGRSYKAANKKIVMSAQNVYAF